MADKSKQWSAEYAGIFQDESVVTAGGRDVDFIALRGRTLRKIAP